jgi:putative ABC transport system permease protein
MLRFAFRFIRYDKIKSIGVTVGIIICTSLVGQQVGIFLFLTGAMSAVVDNTQADLWVVDNKTTDANALGHLDMRVGRQAESIPGVRKVSPIVIAGGTAKFQGARSAPVTLVGSQPPDFAAGPWKVARGSVFDLLEEGAVSIDFFERPNLNNADVGTNFELNGRRVFVALMTKGARGFGAAYVFMPIDRARALGKIPPTKASAFLLELETGADPRAVRDAINATIFGVRAWTKADLSRSTVRTILATSGIAFSVGTLILFAAVAGVIIIGLTMYSAAVDRLRDYGTLKAIGADNRFVRRLILTQALFFALIAYGLSVLLIEGFRRGIANSGVIFEYSPTFKAGFFAVTFSIALVGALFALRRLGKLEPASVFRQ